MENIGSILTTSMTFFADASGAVQVMREYVAPTIKVLASLASIASVFFIVHAGYLYMTSSGKPEQLEHAKHVLKNAILGLVIVLAAFTITNILTGAYSATQNTGSATLPSLQAIPPNQVDNGLIDILIKAVVGFLNNIIQAVATPFLGALEFFTKSTPLMVSNPSVFNFWLAMVGISDLLLVIVVALLGFHVMSASTFGLDELEFKHLLPRIGLIFLIMNTSIFMIDGIIALSNVLIDAVGKISGASTVWGTLTEVLKQAGAQSLAALILMLAFLILSVVLLVFYVARLVALFIGAVLSPLVAMVWLIPGFRDFAETAFKTYFVTIFVLFVHVVILQLAASLFTGLSTASGNDVPDTLMAMIVGLATILALLKTQGVMMQFSYVSMGARNMRKIGGQFLNGVNYLGETGRKGARTAVASSSAVKNKVSGGGGKRASSSKSANAIGTSYSQPSSTSRGVKVTRRPAEAPESTPRKTGTTYEAPAPTPMKSSGAKKSGRSKNT